MINQLLKEVRQCEICRDHLPNNPNPIVSANKDSKIAIIGQAPGRIVDETGIPWNDKSGERLMQWMRVNYSSFYNPDNFAIIPMGFCYPGAGKSGDLPPRKECAPKWHPILMPQLEQLKLIILIGSYAQSYYLRQKSKGTLTETVRHYQEYLPEYFVLPHPSPRNNIWIKKNPWFAQELLPDLQNIIAAVLKK